MMPKPIRAIARVARPRVEVEGHTAARPKGIRALQPIDSRKLRLCHTRGSMPGPFLLIPRCLLL